MEQLPKLARQKSVRVQIVLFDIQRTVVALEISRFVVLHPVTKNQILRPRRRADGVSLDKSHSLDHRFQAERMKERVRDGVNAQLLKVGHKVEALKSTRAIKLAGC